jgi:hypothetical protein
MDKIQSTPLDRSEGNGCAWVVGLSRRSGSRKARIGAEGGAPQFDLFAPSFKSDAAPANDCAPADPDAETLHAIVRLIEKLWRDAMARSPHRP